MENYNKSDDLSSFKIPFSNKNVPHLYRFNKDKKDKPKMSFGEKVNLFQTEIKKKKIDWSNGYETINVERDKILEQSMEQFQRINHYKELKIGFNGEVNQDAGGLIREWLTVLFSTLLDKSGLFVKAETDDFSYLAKKNISISQEEFYKYVFIGQILAKALLENLTVNCCFNLLIYKIILEEDITLEDIISIDKPLYHSLSCIQNIENIEELEIYWTIEEKDSEGKIKNHPLKEGGEVLIVTNSEIQEYINARIKYLIDSQDIAIVGIKQGMFDLIDEQYFKIFTASELGLLINGIPFIDLDDWRINTEYRNYESYDNTIINFWSVLETLSQEELSKFLQFSTGSKRVPIGGFRSLESNRGNSSKFCINKVEYSDKGNNFIKAHTCFNRIDLPKFPDLNKLEIAIKYVLKNEFGFGID